MVPEPTGRQKHRLRQVLRVARRARPAGPGTPAAAEAERLAAVLLAAPEVAGARRAACYLSGPAEPGTGPLLHALAQRGVTVLLPVLAADRDLEWAPDDGTRARGRDPSLPDLVEPAAATLGLDAIGTVDVVLVPALAVDRAGGRLGQGGGSYDRALARVPAHVPVIALVHPGELLDVPLPVEPHDRPVDAAATAEGLTWLRPPRLRAPAPT